LQELRQLAFIEASVLSASQPRVNLHGHVMFNVKNPH